MGENYQQMRQAVAVAFNLSAPRVGGMLLIFHGRVTGQRRVHARASCVRELPVCDFSRGGRDERRAELLAVIFILGSSLI